MYGLTLLAVAIVLWSVRELAVGIMTRLRRRKIKRELRINETQRNFAEARLALLKYALSGQIDVDGDIFRTTYGINTAFMRRPDQYAEISRGLASIVKENELRHNETSQTGTEEITEEAKGAVQATADAVGHLIFTHHSALVRFLYKQWKQRSKERSASKLALTVWEKTSPETKEELRTKFEDEEKIKKVQDSVIGMIPKNGSKQHNGRPLIAT